MTSKTSLDDVFEYTGGGQSVPKHVVSVRFHPNVTEISGYAFSWCKNLKELVLNEGLQKIGGYAFLNCTSLGSIKLPSTVTSIGNEAFTNCNNLREVVMEEGLQKIGIYAFHACPSLESITLPSTLNDIGDHAFCGCRNLREVVIMNDETKIGNSTFDRCTSLQSYKLPNLSTRFEAMVRMGYSDIVNKIRNLPGVYWMGGHIVIPAYRIETYEIMLDGSDPGIRKVHHKWATIRSKLDMVVGLIAYYEVKEASTLLQLAFWKSNMNQAEDHPINRQAYRTEVPGPAMDTIMQYLHVKRSP